MTSAVASNHRPANGHVATELASVTVAESLVQLVTSVAAWPLLLVLIHVPPLANVFHLAPLEVVH